MRILFATDGGGAADAAATLLERLGDRDRLRVDVLSVASFDLALAEAEARRGYSPEAARDHAERIAHEGVDRLSRAGFDAEPHVATGHPTLEILHAIDELGCDLVLVGAGRRTWLGQLLLGSVSTAILQAAPSAVLVVRDAGEGSEPVRVTVGADGSDAAQHATRSLSELADPQRCSVLVVSVADATERGSQGLHGTFPPERATAHGDRLLSTLAEGGLSAQMRVAEGHPAQCLLEEADRGGHDLVVVGSRGGGSVTRTPLGSVSDKLVRLTRATLVGR